jgi:LuxR family maltose regulon positive regulatory protein
MGHPVEQHALATKLRPPSPGARHLPRPRLLPDDRRLAGPVRLTLIAAPAGSGKTTLMADWCQGLRDAGGDAAWFSIDAFDNLPRRYLTNLVSAIRTVRPGAAGDAIDLLGASADFHVEYVAESILHALSADPRPLTLFLDDYHEIREEAVHAITEFLVRNAPDSLRIVLGTRRVPPLPLERMRIRGTLDEIRWDDLRFDAGETGAYLNGTCGLELSGSLVDSLRERTEGWAAGLQLAAMAFSGREAPEAVVASVTGAQRKISGYLLEDVFRRQAPAVRRFLLETSILDRMTAPLCDRVTGRRDARRMLETLEAGNLFVVALDDQRSWFRYHALFAEFLRNRLRIDSPEAVETLHDRASEWCEENGLPNEAIQYAIAGGGHARAARLLERSGRELFRRGDFKALRGWLDALPADTVRRSPALSALHAWALGYLADFAAARERIAWAEAALAAGADSPAALPGAPLSPAEAELRIIRSVLGIIRRDEPDATALVPGLADCFPPEEAALRGYAEVALGRAFRADGRLDAALARFEAARTVTEGADCALVNLNARLNEAAALHLAGRGLEAERRFRDALDVAGRRHWDRSLGAAFLRYGLAVVLHDRNRLTEAQEQLSEAIALIEAGEGYGFLGVALVERARANAALRRADLAAADLEHARAIAVRHGVERVAFRADLLDARMAILAGDPVKAARCLESAEADIRVPGAKGSSPAAPGEPREACLIERGRLLLSLKQFEEAGRIASAGIREAAAAGRGRNVVEFRIFQALALDGETKRDKALAVLGEALKAADGNGIVRPFVNAGGRLIPLLRLLEANKAFRQAAAPLLAAMQDRGNPVYGKPEPGSIDEPFHHREIQILDLMAKGLRNKEIGKRLFLSEETVKWYLKRLYLKLYVGTRTEAVAKARKLALIS